MPDGSLARVVWGTDPSVILEAMGIAPVLQRDGGKPIPWCWTLRRWGPSRHPTDMLGASRSGAISGG